MRILLVEDDAAIASSVVDALTESGYSVHHVATGADAIAADPGDTVLLDLGLPDMDGYDVCRHIRANSQVPIIVVTARSEEFDRVLGLELGADDYVVKPFGLRELVARIRAVNRRVQSNGPAERDEPEQLVAGGLVVDRRRYTVSLDGEEIALTPKEFELLVFLAEDVDGVRTRTDIIEHVWDANWFGPTKTVDAHVAGIRKKLGNPDWIVAVRGVGFRLQVPA